MVTVAIPIARVPLAGCRIPDRQAMSSAIRNRESTLRTGPPMRALRAAIGALYLAVHAVMPASAQTANVSGEGSVHTTPAEVGYGVGGVVGTILYAPLKTIFCLFGGIGSLVTLPFSSETAGKVATASCGGTWVITPAVVSGAEPVKFVGESRP